MLIEHVYKMHGEKSRDGSSVSRCPGESCSYFVEAAGETWEQKAEESCRACGRCSAPALNPYVTVVPSKYCPGENSCSWFVRVKAPTREERADQACGHCPFKDSKPSPYEPASVENTDNYEDLINEISEIVKMDYAGFKVDFKSIDYVRGSLFVEWMNAEKQIGIIQSFRHQAFIKAHYEERK